MEKKNYFNISYYLEDSLKDPIRGTVGRIVDLFETDYHSYYYRSVLSMLIADAIVRLTIKDEEIRKS